MSPTPHALTGAAAAALYQLDGFRDLEWPLRWCTPRSGTSANDAIRTRHFATSPIFGDPPVVAPRLMLRHLGEHLGDLAVPEDRVTPKERIELAVEHAIRIDLVGPTELWVPYSSRPGDCVLREIGLWRAGQPPTESYAETRADQLLRSFGFRCWRQVPIVGPAHRVLYRTDFVLPYVWTNRPTWFRPDQGLIIEIDSREHHEPAFEKDHARQSTYDRLGYRWVSFTPNQIEHQPAMVRRTIEGVLATVQTRSRRRAS